MHVADRVRQGEWRATGRSQRGDAKTLNADNEHPLPAAIDALSRLWIRLNSSLPSQHECEGFSSMQSIVFSADDVSSPPLKGSMGRSLPTHTIL